MLAVLLLVTILYGFGQAHEDMARCPHGVDQWGTDRCANVSAGHTRFSARR
jgi:hypothetical protein